MPEAQEMPDNSIPFPTQNKNKVVQQSAFAPIVERVAVPAMWFGLGYLICKLTQKRSILG